MSKKLRLIFSTSDSPNFLDGTEFDDKDLSTIPESTVTLHLELSKVTDIGINQLPKLPGLICLDLDGTAITDESMRKIGEISSLKELWVEQTNISNEGIKHLVNLKKLEFISIVDTAVTREGAQFLRQNIAGIQIH